MFCTSCGSAVPNGASFCVACGVACGQPAGTPAAAAPAGTWGKLPGRKDMAKFQFGSSSCQIEGVNVPVADMNLHSSDSVYFAHHVLLWKDVSVAVTAMSLAGGWKRLFAGMPLIMTQASGPGHIAFSRDAPGEMIALPLHPGQFVDVKEHLFLTATGNVTYDWFTTNIWFQTRSGDDQETHYPVGMFMDRFSAPRTPGLLLLHAAGNVFVRELAPGQSILIKPTALVFKDPSVQMHLHFERPNVSFSLWRTWSNRYLWLRVTGPGGSRSNPYSTDWKGNPERSTTSLPQRNKYGNDIHKTR